MGKYLPENFFPQVLCVGRLRQYDSLCPVAQVVEVVDRLGKVRDQFPVEGVLLGADHKLGRVNQPKVLCFNQTQLLCDALRTIKIYLKIQKIAKNGEKRKRYLKLRSR